ncbi:cyclin-dependent kinases regulatory subunit 2 isoform X1 [Stegostoma tigrinum]|uniref:cyclin-dependent kinases regulatory subunit 2 isoform X1 n=1 Tax=Stegostoma tigrinum TaxID=3053191 RepID=UPI00202B4756|nr:cyclin-dependent kinases regulatory subunit 2 isoform X1 [Stegostoma tigrinum]
MFYWQDGLSGVRTFSCWKGHRQLSIMLQPPAGGRPSVPGSYRHVAFTSCRANDFAVLCHAFHWSSKVIPRKSPDWHVMLPKELAKQVPKTHLMSEDEWRKLGVQQSLGWVHYMMHEPEPHILLFRRPLSKDQEK